MSSTIDIQGHRGCRGLMPENTILAFIKAIDLGVSTLELDVTVTKDSEVVVSHEPFFNHEISIAPDGTEITEGEEKKHNMYPLTLSQIQKYDVGLRTHPRFPIQKKTAAQKPSLIALVSAVEAYLADENLESVGYNIEIKRKPEGDNVYHPDMQSFANQVIRTITDLGIMDRTTVQCFDTETLIYLRRTYPAVRLVYLIEKEGDLVANLDKIGFVPEIYSPDFKLVNAELVEACKNKEMLLIPWTVNDESDIEAMITLGVDGIISDYPDRVIEIVESRKLSK